MNPHNRPYFHCVTCGFHRHHRYANYGFDGYLAMWRVMFHCWIRGHVRPT